MENHLHGQDGWRKAVSITLSHTESYRVFPKGPFWAAILFSHPMNSYRAIYHILGTITHLGLKLWARERAFLFCVIIVSIAALTNHHILSGSKQHTFIIFQFCTLKVQNRPHWTEIKVSARVHSFLVAPGKSISLPLQLLEAAHSPWLMAPLLHLQSRQWCMSPVILPWSWLSLTFSCLPFYF